MQIVRPLVVVALLLAGFAALGARPTAAQAPAAFTAGQAATGEKIFAAQCSMCHGTKLEGGAGPQLAGPDFLAKWTGQTAADIHDIVSEQMPLTSPGSLKPAEALAVVAYILQQNHYPSGDTALTATSLKSVKIAKP